MSQLNAIRETAEELTARSARATHLGHPSGPPEPGDLYVFDLGETVGLEWLVVQFHPDDATVVLLGPVDDFPLAAAPDLVVPVAERSLTVRCGETDWFPANLCAPRSRTGFVPEQVLATVRQRLADFAHGRPVAIKSSAESDPEYEEWMGEVARARISLLARDPALTTPAQRLSI